jgi:hypothetical protein
MSSKGKKSTKVPEGAVNVVIKPEEIFDNVPPNQ